MLSNTLPLWVLILSSVCTGVRFKHYLKHFEPLTYDSEEIHQHHLRHKRSISSNPFVNINFHAHGRHFHLRLKRDVSVFSNSLQVDSPSGVLENFDTSHLYEGQLWGEAETSVFGSIRDGVFDGNIHTPQGTYFVERSYKYFPQDAIAGFHSIIYHERDLRDSLHKNHQEEGYGGCGVTDDVLQWMQNISHSAVEDSEPDKKNTSNDANKVLKEIYTDLPMSHYSRKFQKVGKEHTRQKRSTQQKRACSLYIQTDTLLWREIHKHEKDPMKTREEITSLIAQHVRAVNFIYQDADFKSYRGIKFVVQRITINDTSACNSTEKRLSNPFCSENIDVSNFLNLNSQIRHDAFCLAYVFTYRDFSGGTLGLAWVASPQGASGGICEKYKSYTENVGGRPIQTKRSLNTGIITFVNYNTRVPPKVSQLTLAHEIGHNFGSPHDFPPQCKPGGPDGNYIMFASATSGDLPNNSQFSSCSLKNITAVLQAIYTHSSGKTLCLLNDSGAFCGNKIVEEGEQCDCGYDEDECNDKCCYPRNISPHRNENGSAKPCTRRAGVKCSPSEGPCCDKDCQFENGTGGFCRAESECSHSSRCTGNSSLCPPSVPKADIVTECNENTRVCKEGECSGSICLKYNMEECFLTKNDGASPEKLCELACQNKSKPTTCKTIYDHLGHNYMGIKLRPGSPCDNYQGYCDVFQKCRAVDAEGPLARLKNLLFSQDTLTSVAQWITENWWAVLLSGVSFIIVMGMFIKCCAVHTPSSNPKKPPARRISDTLRRPAQTLRRKVGSRHRHHQTAPQMSQAPPPYSGRAGPSHGPAHGYGEGRGHYNRPKPGQSSWTAEDPYAAAYPGRNHLEMRQHKV